MKFKFLISIFIYISISFSLFGQDNNIFIKKNKTDFKNLIKQVENKTNISFFYNYDSIPNVNIDIKKDSISLDTLLRNAFSQYKINISKDNNGNYFLFKNFTLQTNVDNIFINEYVNNGKFSQQKSVTNNSYIKSSQNFISENIIIRVNNTSKNKTRKVKLSGIISDILDGSPIYQASMKFEELNKTILTNHTGYYEIDLLPGVYTICVNSIGMYEKTYRITIFHNGKLDISLKTESFAIEEITITANKSDNVKSTNMGFEKITSKSIKALPSILGEKDIVKIALLLPGVQTIGELSSGFNVRGSPTDQNIFYINDLPIYNSSHVFGLFTAFNGDAINEFNFYKSNLPIDFGGHLSSIFEIKTKKGSHKHFSARGGIGPTSSRLLIEGPIKKNYSSYLVSIRSSYSDWILRMIKNPDINNSSISFYDAILDFSFALNKKNNLNVFFYGSNDFSDIAFGIKNQYSNIGSSFKWTHTFNKNLKSELYILKSKYYYNEENKEIEYLGYKHSFDLNHNESKLKFKYNLYNIHFLKFGLNLKFYKLNFGDFLPLNELSSIKPVKFESEQALSNSIFIGDKWKVSNKLSFEAGVRYTYYVYLGAKTIYKYEENTPRILNNIIDSITFGKNEFISNNSNFNYNFSGKYEISRTSSLKASYNLLHQYIFMLSNTVSVSPTNNWKLSDTHLKPMSGEQYSFGFYKNLPIKSIETSFEVYYKNIKNLVEYKDGATFLANKLPETNIIQGNLKSYGFEFMLKKKSGNLNGWINYTYSNASVKALDIETGEMNNQGITYSANYDRPHAVNLTLNYKLSKRVSISTNIVYSSGRPVTYPTSIYYINDIQITGFSRRNEYRIPDYFRADLSINIEGNLKKYKLAHGSWSLSFYNLTARKNPYSIVFQNEFGKIKGYKISILGTIIPSINYNLKFGNYEN